MSSTLNTHTSPIPSDLSPNRVSNRQLRFILRLNRILSETGQFDFNQPDLPLVLKQDILGVFQKIDRLCKRYGTYLVINNLVINKYSNGDFIHQIFSGFWHHGLSNIIPQEQEVAQSNMDRIDLPYNMGYISVPNELNITQSQLLLRGIGQAIDQYRNKLLYASGVHSGMTDLLEKLAQAIQEAGIDELTKAGNRNGLNDYMNALRGEIRMSDYPKQMKIGVLFLDIDHFKAVNDTLGHDVGDVILARFVRYAVLFLRSKKEELGVNINMFRFGGEEFCVMIEGDIDENQMQALAEELQVHLANCVYEISPSSRMEAVKKRQKYLRERSEKRREVMRTMDLVPGLNILRGFSHGRNVLRHVVRKTEMILTSPPKLIDVSDIELGDNGQYLLRRTASIGATLISVDEIFTQNLFSDEDVLSYLLKVADLALYKAKETRNTAVFYSFASQLEGLAKFIDERRKKKQDAGYIVPRNRDKIPKRVQK